MAAEGQVGAAHHAGHALDLAGDDQVDEGLPVAAQELLEGTLGDAGDGGLVAMVRQQVQGNLATALLVGADDLVDDGVAVRLPVGKDEGAQLGVGLLGHVVQADLLDLQLVADGLDAGEGAVKLGEDRVDGAGGQHRLGGVVVAGVAHKHLLVMAAPQLEILPHTGAAHQPDPLGAGGLGLGGDILLDQPLLEVGKGGVLVTGNHHIDVRGIDHVQAHRGGADLRLAQHHVVEQIGEGQAVDPGGDAQLQAVEEHVHRIGVQVGGALHHALDNLRVGAAGQDAQLLPLGIPGGIGHLLQQVHLLVGRQVQIIQHRLGNRQRVVVLVPLLDAKQVAQVGKGLLPLDLPLGQGGVLQIPGGVLHNVDVAAGAAGHRPQEVAGHDDIGGGAADPPGGSGGNPAGSVGTQPAADTLQAEAALDRLALYPMVGRLHRQRADKALQGLVGALTGFTSKALIHLSFLHLAGHPAFLHHISQGSPWALSPV